MNNKRKPDDSQDKIERLEAFLDGLDEDKTATPEQRKALFEERGWSVQRTLDAVHDRLARPHAKERLEKARAERATLLERMLSRKPSDPSRLKRIWGSLQSLAGSQPQLAVYFRKFEEATPEDIESLLEELAFLEDLDAERE